MTKTSVYCLLSVLLGVNLLIAYPVYPWSSKGHEIVGHIAQENLTDQVWKKVKTILRPQSSVNKALARAAVWPDRTGRKIEDMNPFHFVNFTAEDTTYNRSRNCPRRNCIVEAILWYRRVMVDNEAPHNVRRIALRFVVHLVGDIHQPLHAGHRSDREGREIYVEYRESEVSLHRLWDSKLIKAAEQGSSVDVAKRLNEDVTPNDRQAWQGGTVSEWAVESLKLARSHAYKVPETGVINVNYVRRALPVVRQRLAQAGIRLGWVLNEAFK